MTQALAFAFPIKHPKVSYAATTPSFDDREYASAIAWPYGALQNRSPDERAVRRNRPAARQLASAAASTALVVFLLPADAAAIDVTETENPMAVRMAHHTRNEASSVSHEPEENTLGRGVFAPEPVRQAIFSRKLHIKTADLPRWEPHITISQRWVDDDDE